MDSWTEIDIDSQNSKIEREPILQIGILIVCEVHRTTQCPICHFVVITSLQTTTQMAPSAFMALLPVYTSTGWLLQSDESYTAIYMVNQHQFPPGKGTQTDVYEVCSKNQWVWRFKGKIIPDLPDSHPRSLRMAFNSLMLLSLGSRVDAMEGLIRVSPSLMSHSLFQLCGLYGPQRGKDDNSWVGAMAEQSFQQTGTKTLKLLIVKALSWVSRHHVANSDTCFYIWTGIRNQHQHQTSKDHITSCSSYAQINLDFVSAATTIRTAVQQDLRSKTCWGKWENTWEMDHISLKPQLKKPSQIKHQTGEY